MAALVWLHGVGDTGAGWRGQFRAVEAQVPGLKCVHPDAPVQPLTADGGSRMNSWFDIVKWIPGVKPIGLDEPDPAVGLDDTVKMLHEQFEKLEKSGVPAEKIAVGGFSQGGTAAIIAGLTYPKKIGGIVSISGWCAHRETLFSKVPDGDKAPLLFCCGTDDSVIHIDLEQGV
eukprot:CAMPEP_0180670942 /NCGR_PEP_ID=MMETSP1037_2-20121125/64311_1 /TAXON_ID=632150 /ORGANISM="Azadinium spinosum, Strain 3D9" /LENGTH=172 /DNA_ID=CAMNT_0022699939 /DNA_START=49 /DNA_END=566 /DNA_ORIENTATION=+